MPRAPSLALLRALRHPRLCTTCARQISRSQHTTARQPIPITPLRKQLKEESHARRKAKPPSNSPLLQKYTLTVGIEIHAELNTAHKLFSRAQTSLNDAPNTHVALFDAAIPGTQPEFQPATLVPAIRAALALNCTVNPRSSFDRKHYFHWDQPHGYQLTQYYAPLATGGHITLYEHDDIDPADGPEVVVGIKQVQMEQDTAKTVAQPPATHLLDFNRVSHPLVEIITLPQMHSAKTAAALVRKVQALLRAVDANTTGMELGGLRADVNVSVRRTDAADDPLAPSYAGVRNLGVRTEIKNLSSFKAIEEAIEAERDRQIGVVEAGGVVEQETRGWTLGSSETRRLRGKEGEVDYRYMPDPDLAPVLVSRELVQQLRDTMPMLPDEAMELLTGHQRYGLGLKDAKALVGLDDGDRLDYYLQVVDLVCRDKALEDGAKVGKTVANWVLNDIPTFAAARETRFPYETPDGRGTAELLAELLALLLRGKITNLTARQLLGVLVSDEAKTVQQVVDEQGLLLVEMSDGEYEALARAVVEGNEKMVQKVRQDHESGRGEGKIMWFVGQMVRRGDDGKVRPEVARTWVRRVIFE